MCPSDNYTATGLTLYCISIINTIYLYCLYYHYCDLFNNKYSIYSIYIYLFDLTMRRNMTSDQYNNNEENIDTYSSTLPVVYDNDNIIYIFELLNCSVPVYLVHPMQQSYN